MMTSDTFTLAWQWVITWDDALSAIVWRSLQVSGGASILAWIIGAGVGAWLGMAQFWGRRGLLAVLHTLLALPSVVVGLMGYLLLSRAGPLGFLGWLYTVQGMILAQTLLTLPLAIGLIQQTIETADTHHGEHLKAWGAKAWQRALLLLWDERQALMIIAITVFGRAIAEVGAVMMVGGNIDGFTRVMTTTIALETSRGDLPLALALGMVLLGLVLWLHLGLILLQRATQRTFLR